MKTLNISGKRAEKGSYQSMMENYSDRMPCWYVNFEHDGEDREEAQWVVGVKSEEGQECTIKVARAGDVENEEFWKFATSAECAIEILNLFKEGGEKQVVTWVKNGCPR